MKISAYTIGNTENYTKALAEDPKLLKCGRDLNDPNAYEGGAVFRDRDAAQKFIDENSYPYSVYGLALPNGWEEDVDEAKESDEGFCRLLNDSRIVPLK
jgi:hypothetical protein